MSSIASETVGTVVPLFSLLRSSQTCKCPLAIKSPFSMLAEESIKSINK